MTDTSKLIQGRTGPWEIVLGLEVHAQVASNAKLFSGAAVGFGAGPNAQVSLVDAGMPGMLPVINRHCVEQAIRTGLGLKAQINAWSRFDRRSTDGLAKVVVGLTVVLTTSVVLYSFDLFEGGWGLVPIGMVADSLGAPGVTGALHVLGGGLWVGVLVSAYSLAQLLSALIRSLGHLERSLGRVQLCSELAVVHPREHRTAPHHVALLDEHRRQRERDEGDLIAEEGDRLPEPEVAELALPEERHPTTRAARVDIGEQPAARGGDHRRVRVEEQAALRGGALPVEPPGGFAGGRVERHEHVGLRQHHGAVVDDAGGQRLGERCTEGPQ